MATVTWCQTIARGPQQGVVARCQWQCDRRKVTVARCKIARRQKPGDNSKVTEAT